MILDQNLLATSAVVQAHRLAVIPESLSLEDAASLSVAVPAAIYALLYAGNLQKGQSVLIQSAFDDVGHAAIQIARMAEAEVRQFLPRPSANTDRDRSTALSRKTQKPPS
jgi:NADPH:quinone reductase-like Zn-dependent oxidoreductase